MKVLELLLVGWLPGAVVFRAPIGERDKRAGLDAEERVFWAVVLSVAISLALTLALASAHRYSFRRLLILDGMVAAVAAVASRFRLRFGAAAARPTVAAMVPLVLALICAWRFYPPSEYIIGGKDPGVYVNEGVQIAQRGALVVHDPVISSVPAFARDLFFPSYKQPDYYSVRFMGFFISDPGSGEIVCQFPHLFPASIAIGYGVDGLTGARRVFGVWAMLGVVAVYFAAARLIGRPGAAATAGLLALNVIEVWFARYPNAETVMQALLFAAILASARALVDGDTFFAPVSGALLTLLLFLRFDAVLAIAGVLAAVVLSVFKGRRMPWPFFAVLAAGTALAVAYLLGPLRAYATLPIVFLSNLPWWEYAIFGGATLAGLWAFAAGARQPRIAALVSVITPLLLSIVVLLLAAYALVLRHPGGKLTDYDAYALRSFAAWYVTVPGLIAALVGYAMLMRRAFWRDPALVLTITIFACFFFYKIRIAPVHFWTARRFLPVILPGTLLLACAAALGGERRGPRSVRLLHLAIGLTFVSVLAFQFARAAQPVLPHVEYAGIIPRLEQLAGTIGDDDLLLVESRQASDTHVLALPLAYIYARPVLVLASRLPDKPTFAAFLEWAHTKYKRVLFMGGGGTDLLSRNWSVVPLSSDRFQIPEYDAPRNAYPRGVREKEFDYSIYAFAPPSSDATARPFDLDIGVRDDLHVVHFHAKEISGGTTFRWSQNVSYISVTSMPPDARQITIWMNDGGRPSGVPPADVSVYLSDHLVGTARVTTGFRAYSFKIPPGFVPKAGSSGDPVRLTLATPTWNPARSLGTPDNRDLGVMVDRVAVR